MVDYYKTFIVLFLALGRVVSTSIVNKEVDFDLASAREFHRMLREKSPLICSESTFKNVRVSRHSLMDLHDSYRDQVRECWFRLPRELTEMHHVFRQELGRALASGKIGFRDGLMNFNRWCGKPEATHPRVVGSILEMEEALKILKTFC